MAMAMARIAAHNKKILKGGRGSNMVPDTRKCMDKSQCPLIGVEPCNVCSVIYRAQIQAQGVEDRFYMGGPTTSSSDCGHRRNPLGRKAWRIVTTYTETESNNILNDTFHAIITSVYIDIKTFFVSSQSSVIIQRTLIVYYSVYLKILFKDKID